MDCVPVKLHSPVDWLRSKPSDLADASAERHVPCASRNIVTSRRVGGAGRIPVRRHDWSTGEVITLLQVVVDKVLQQHLIHIRSMRGTGDRKHIADQGADRPLPWLHKRYHRRPKAELTLACLRTRSGRQDERRSQSIDELPRIRWREEERGIHISNTNLPTCWLLRIRLPDKRLDHPSDQHDLVVELHGNDRLNIEDIPGSVIRPDAKIAVVLQRKADENCDWILSCLG